MAGVVGDGVLTRSPDLPRGASNALVLPCIDCRRPLPGPPWACTTEYGAVLDDVVECPTCHLRYSGELLRTAHPESWAYIMLNGLFCRECGDRHIVVVYAEGGHPVPCPVHGDHAKPAGASTPTR